MGGRQEMRPRDNITKNFISSEEIRRWRFNKRTHNRSCESTSTLIHCSHNCTCKCVTTLLPPVNDSCPAAKLFLNPLGNQVTSRLPSTPDSTTIQAESTTRDSFEWVALRISLPLSFVLCLLVFTIILMRRFYRKKKKRSERPNAVQLAENATLLEQMSSVQKNSGYFVPNHEESYVVTRILMDRIYIQESIGEGAFGQVFKGELADIQSEGPNKLIAIKVLKEGASREIREDFDREVAIMSSFAHDNILRLIGIVADDNLVDGNTPYMVFEYMIHGDLAELLRRNDPTMRAAHEAVVVKKQHLPEISTQIAAGMVYLADRHFVHRDLATRNCLVGEGLVVKISDFGMSRDVYTCDYYKVGGSRMLPVRWMAPESIKYGRFTTESDVWSFGVVLWEIFSFGRQPYYGNSNDEVVRFLDEGVLLCKPDNCEREMYQLMTSCWKRDPKDRLVFSDLHQYLADRGGRVSTGSSTTNIADESAAPRLRPIFPSNVSQLQSASYGEVCQLRDLNQEPSSPTVHPAKSFDNILYSS